MPIYNIPTLCEYLQRFPTLRIRVAVRRYPRFVARCVRHADRIDAAYQTYREAERMEG